jgi:serine protease
MIYSKLALTCLFLLTGGYVNAQDAGETSRNLRALKNNGNGNGNGGNGNPNGVPNPNRFIVHGTDGDGNKESEVEQETLNSGGSVKMSIGSGTGKKVVVELPPNAQANGFKNRMAAKGFKLEVDQPRYADHSVKDEIDHIRQLQEEIPWGITKVFGGNENIPSPTELPQMTHPICIIDSGYSTAHPDLPSDATNADPNQGANSANPFNIDGCQHGTHVAGTIAANDNDVGVIGVFPGAPGIKVVKVFGEADNNSCGWSYSSSLIQAAQYCVDDGAKIITMSLGGGYASTTEANKFEDFFTNNGVLSIAAAGNSGNTAYSYPASYDYVMSVAATDQSNARASFSQYNNQVDIAAPGVGVKSTIGNGSYASWSGTSMATPHVSGVALLLWNNHPTCNAEHIRNALESTAQDLGTAGKDNEYGHGLVRYDLANQYLTANGCTSPPTQPPSPCDGKLVEVTIVTDNYPSETAWTIKSTDGVTQASSSPYTSTGTTYVDEVCVPSNSCTFEITDSYGDGICCGYGSGSYIVKVNGNTVGDGGEFGSAESVNLCTAPPTTPPPTSSPTKSPTDAPTKSPTASPTAGIEQVTVNEGGRLQINMGSDVQKLMVQVVNGKFHVEFVN